MEKTYEVSSEFSNIRSERRYISRRIQINSIALNLEFIEEHCDAIFCNESKKCEFSHCVTNKKGSTDFYFVLEDDTQIMTTIENMVDAEIILYELDL